MKRRQFLGAGSVLVGAAALPHGAVAATAAPRFTLLRLDAGAGRYLPIEACGTQVQCDAAQLTVHLHALRPAPGGAVLAQLRLSALFDAVGAPQSPFHMLHFSAAQPEQATRPYRFHAARDALRSLQIDYRLHDGIERSERCGLVTHAFAPLAPGEYVLAGPRRGGGTVDPALVDAAARDFDTIALRLDAAA